MKLAIKGHATRGKEVIKLLEMLGGRNKNHCTGIFINLIYFINENGYIESTVDFFKKCHYETSTLEEFEKLYPYKVGDKVVVSGFEKCGVDEIITMFETYDGDIKYKTKNHRDTHYFTVDRFRKVEENMNIPEAMKAITDCVRQLVGKTNDFNSIKMDNKTTITFECKSNGTDVELVIPDNIELINQNGKFLIKDKKPQYPKTPAKCMNVLKIQYSCKESEVLGYKSEMLSKFQELLICRDAYWKIAGEQMELGKLWEPSLSYIQKHKSYSDENEKLYNILGLNNCILSFPTEEMRDAFYENFKKLIEECKELL